MSDADIYNAITRFSFLSFSNRRFGKKRIVIFLLLSFFVTFSVHSAIRIMGPQNVDPASTALQEGSLAPDPISTVNRPLFMGPTRASDTLWSIAREYTSNNPSVTIYQAIGAIFRLNPNAFKNDNIHDLQPGNLLMMPTISEMDRESTANVAQRLQVDKTRRKAQKKATDQPVSKSLAKVKTNTQLKPLAALKKIQVTPIAKVEAKEKSTSNINSEDFPKTTGAPLKPLAAAKKTQVTSLAKVDAKQKSASNTKAEDPPKTQMMAKSEKDVASNSATSKTPKEAMEFAIPTKRDMGTIQEQIDASDLQMGKLLESNHIMKIRLAEIRNELLTLKDQMTDDGDLTKKIRVFLDAHRKREAQIEMQQKETLLESLVASPLMLATMAIIPALMVIGTAFFILRRRKEDPEEVPEALDNPIPEDMPVIMLPDEDDADELILDDEDEEEINLSDDLLLTDEPEESGLDLDSDMDFSSSMDLGIPPENEDSALLSDDVSMNSAIGLEDMDIARDEMTGVSDEPELSPDEAMAAAWEKSLSEGSGAEVDDIDALLAAEALSTDPDPLTDQQIADEISSPENADLSDEDLVDVQETDIDENSPKQDGNLEQEIELEQEQQLAPSLDLLSLPEYDEQAALEDNEFSPDTERNREVEPDGWDNDEALDLANFPEYTEQDAESDLDLPLPENEQNPLKIDTDDSLSSDLETELAIEKERAIETELAPETALAPETKNATDFTATQISTLAFPPVDSIGVEDLGEFDENDALDAALAEQRELDESVPEQKNRDFNQQSSPISQHFNDSDFNEPIDFNDDSHQIAGLNMDALLSEFVDEDEQDLPEFDLDELEIPEEESDIWSAKTTPEPELESEDWSQQPEISDDDLEAATFGSDLESLLDEGESDLVYTSPEDDGYISIEQLLKDDGEPQEDPDSLPLDLDVGLEDFPDILSEVEPGDVDEAGEAATQMDLAKAYLEMNDIDGALELLEKVVRGDNESLKMQARKMIESLN